MSGNKKSNNGTYWRLLCTLCILGLVHTLSILSASTEEVHLFFPSMLSRIGTGVSRLQLRSNNTSALDDTTSRMPENPRMYLIHVGKTGGITLRKALRLSRRDGEAKCRANRTLHGEDDSACDTSTDQDSQLTRHIVQYFHMHNWRLGNDVQEWTMNNTNVFLFIVRDPIGRIISTYNYHRDDFSKIKDPNKKRQQQTFYKECYPSGLNDMIDTMRRNDTSTNATKCTKMGIDTLTGKGNSYWLPGGWHFGLNYHFYKKNTMDKFANHSIATIRTEHMWDDVEKLDKLLGGTGEFGASGSRHTHGSEKYKQGYSSDLSLSNAIFLCCLIWKEIETYQDMILKSFNLDNAEKMKAMFDLLNRCHIKTPMPTDVLKEPFSWEEFGNEEQCRSITDIK